MIVRLHADARSIPLPDGSVHAVVTSPPYFGLRKYAGVEPSAWGGDPAWLGCLGNEPTVDLYVAHLVEVFREVRRVLRSDGTLWLNLGDSYATGGRGTYRNPGSDVEPIEHGGKQAYTREYARQQPNRMPIPGLKPKDLVGIPWLVAFALRADGWWLRSEIIWAKPNPMPESVADRPTKAHETIFLLTKSAKYAYDADAIREPAEWARWGDQTVVKPQQGTAGWIGNKTKAELEKRRTTDKQRGHSRRHAGFNDRWDAMDKAEQGANGRNARSVWTIATEPYPEAHFATFPTELPRRCILAGCPEGGTVLDPFLGSGTTAQVAKSLGRKAIGIELNPEYLALAVRRNEQMALMMEVANRTE